MEPTPQVATRPEPTVPIRLDEVEAAEEDESGEAVEPIDPAFRSALVNAWVSSQMERDKAILTVSSAAIGLLVTLLKFFVPSSLQVACYIFAFAGFGLAIVSAIRIFERNGHYIRSLLGDDTTPDNDERLESLDKQIKGGFYIGLAAVLILGLSSFVDPTASKPTPDPDERQEQTTDPNRTGDGLPNEEPQQLFDSSANQPGREAVDE